MDKISGTLKLVLLFDDGTTQTLTINNIQERTAQQLAAMKTQIIDLNTNIGVKGSDYENFPTILVSKYGGHWVRIEEAEFITTNREYLF